MISFEQIDHRSDGCVLPTRFFSRRDLVPNVLTRLGTQALSTPVRHEIDPPFRRVKRAHCSTGRVAQHSFGASVVIEYSWKRAIAFWLKQLTTQGEFTAGKMDYFVGCRRLRCERCMNPC